MVETLICKIHNPKKGPTCINVAIQMTVDVHSDSTELLLSIIHHKQADCTCSRSIIAMKACTGHMLQNTTHPNNLHMNLYRSL